MSLTGVIKPFSDPIRSLNAQPCHRFILSSPEVRETSRTNYRSMSVSPFLSASQYTDSTYCRRDTASLLQQYQPVRGRYSYSQDRERARERQTPVSYTQVGSYFRPVSPDWSYFISELSGPEDLPCSSLGNYLITFFSVEDRAEGEQYTNTSDQWLAPLPGPGSSVDQSVPRDRETERHQALHSHLRAAQGLHLPQEYRQLVLPLWPRSYWNIILDKYTYHNVSTPPTNCFLGLGGYYQEYINIWEYVELSIYIPVLGPAAACRS